MTKAITRFRILIQIKQTVHVSKNLSKKKNILHVLVRLPTWSIVPPFIQQTFRVSLFQFELFMQNTFLRF